MSIIGNAFLPEEAQAPWTLSLFKYFSYSPPSTVIEMASTFLAAMHFKHLNVKMPITSHVCKHERLERRHQCKGPGSLSGSNMASWFAVNVNTNKLIGLQDGC